MDQAEYDSLTPTERRVLRLIVPGFTTAMIAGELGMAPGTADTHIKRARAKLGGLDRVRAGAALRTYENPAPSPGTPPHGTTSGMEEARIPWRSGGADRSMVIDRNLHEVNEARTPFEIEQPRGREPQKGRAYDRNPVLTIGAIAVTILALVVAVILAVSLSESAQSLARTIFKQR